MINRMSAYGPIFYRGAIILIGTLIYSGIPEYLKLSGPTNIPPLLFGILLILMALLRSNIRIKLLSTTELQNIKKIKLLFGWFVLFILFGAFSVAYHDANNYSLEDLARRISAAFFFGCLLLFSVLSKEITAEQHSPHYLVQNLMWAVVLGGGVLAASVLLGAYQLAFLTPGSCRQGGFYMNANGAAYALALSVWFGSIVIKSVAYRTLFQAFLILALILTMSRSGYIIAAIIFTAICIARKVDAWLFLRALILLLILSAGVVWIQGEFSRGSCLWNAVIDRTIKFKVGGDHEDDSRIVLDAGSADRLNLITEARNKFKENVYFGSGIDADNGERSHNQALAFLSQHGLGGGVLFFGFWALIIWTGMPKGLAIGLFIISMFDHTFFYNRYILIVIFCGLGLTMLRKQNDLLKPKNG